MLKVAICDDEQKDIDIAEKCILEYSFKHNLDIECANYRTGQELLDKMESGEHYDFFVFDVEMKKEDGICIASIIRKRYDKNAIIIFVSNYPGHMGRSFSVHAYNYIQKPLKYIELEQVLSQVLREIRDMEFNKLIVPAADGERVVNMSDIMYIETSRKFQKSVDIHSAKEIIQVTGNLKKWFNLLKDKRFVYSFKGYIVNIDHIVTLRGGELVLDNNEIIPLSRKYEEEVRKSLINTVISDMENTRG